MDMTSKELLLEWCRYGWKYRKIAERPQTEQDWYVSRIHHELGLILSKDFADYFLMVSDAVRWAKDQGIAVGPGRGSSAASVICWLLRITEIDPHKYPIMLFERFLDETRQDMPDIDTDFDDKRRHEVRDYLASKYGPECVGQIANFVRYKGKNSLVDVASVYNVPKWAKETVSRLVIERSGGDSRSDATLEDTAATFPDAAKVFEQFPELWKAARLEGNTRGMSVHAAGLVIGRTPLTDICAVYERDGVRCLSVDKWDIEYTGAVKLDFLGLTTMGVIAHVMRLTGLTIEDIYAIPDDDAKTLDVFRRGDVVGIFQFEGRATRLVNRDVCPDNFQEVADVNALSRPGPLFSWTTAQYCDVKHGRMEPERYHPLIDEITRDTRYQIVYQEQILKIVKEIGGFDWTHTVEIRRIISKRWGQQAFQVNMERFQQGALDLHGISFETSEKVWKKIVTSGTYAFVAAHAISYATVAWWTAWLKIHFPREFYAASLSAMQSASGNNAIKKARLTRLMHDAEKNGVNIVPPVLNASGIDWKPVKSLGVVAGWSSIPGIGKATAERINAQRAQGKFGSWDDLQQIPGIGPKTIETMQAFATAHDPFGLKSTQDALSVVLKAVRLGAVRAPTPTHDGLGVTDLGGDAANFMRSGKNRKGPKCCWAGLVRLVQYKDAAEDARSRLGTDMEEILAGMYKPEFLKYATLQCYDTTEDEVYLRINRFIFPKYRRQLELIRPDHDVVIATGQKIMGAFGNNVAITSLYVIDPD